jgi:hypothetical protein
MGQTKSIDTNYKERLVFIVNKVDTQTTDVLDYKYPEVKRELYNQDELLLFDKKVILIHKIICQSRLKAITIYTLNNIQTIEGLAEFVEYINDDILKGNTNKLYNGTILFNRKS